MCIALLVVFAIVASMYKTCLEYLALVLTLVLTLVVYGVVYTRSALLWVLD